MGPCEVSDLEYAGSWMLTNFLAGLLARTSPRFEVCSITTLHGLPWKIKIVKAFYSRMDVF